jgi:hypothetical protein
VMFVTGARPASESTDTEAITLPISFRD